jgi:hypothetical protein
MKDLCDYCLDYPPICRCQRYINARWDDVGRVHDWRNYISDELAEMWGTFTDRQKVAIGRSADETARREEWD